MIRPRRSSLMLVKWFDICKVLQNIYYMLEQWDVTFSQKQIMRKFFLTLTNDFAMTINDMFGQSTTNRHI